MKGIFDEFSSVKNGGGHVFFFFFLTRNATCQFFFGGECRVLCFLGMTHDDL